MPILPITFTNPNLPSAKSLRSQIKEIPNLFAWAQADPAYVTLTGEEITKFKDVAGGLVSFDPTGTNTRADLVPNQIGGHSVARFYGATSADDGAADQYAATGGVLVSTAPYSYVVVFKASDAADAANLISRYTDASNRSAIYMTGGLEKIRVLHGSTVTDAPITLNTWNYAIASHDGENLHLRVNGAAATSKATTGGAGTGPLTLNALNTTGTQSFDGDMSDVMVFSSDIIGSGDYAVVEQYIRQVYGL